MITISQLWTSDVNLRVVTQSPVLAWVCLRACLCHLEHVIWLGWSRSQVALWQAMTALCRDWHALTGFVALHDELAALPTSEGRYQKATEPAVMACHERSQLASQGLRTGVAPS